MVFVPFKNEIHQLIRLRRNTLVATSDISLPGPVQIEVVRRLVTFFYCGLNDCFTFNFVGDERPFRQRVEVSIDLLADEVCHALRIVQPYDGAIILHTEKERAAFRIGIGADALQPVADLLPLQLTLEIVGHTLGNQFMSLNSHGQSY